MVRQRGLFILFFLDTKKPGAAFAAGQRDIDHEMINSNHNRVSGRHADPPGQIQRPGVQHSSTSKIAAQQPFQQSGHVACLLYNRQLPIKSVG